MSAGDAGAATPLHDPAAAPAPPPRRRGARGALASVALPIARVVGDFVGAVVVRPVRDGRLRMRRWPRGLAPVGIVALAAYALAAVGVVAASVIRSFGPLAADGDISFPVLAVGPVLALVVLALSLAQTAALHSPLWLAIAISTLMTLVLISIGVNDTDGSLVSPGRIAAVVAALGLWALLPLRRRRRYAWGEFVVVFALTATGVAVPIWQTVRRSARFGLDAGPMTLASTMQSVGLLAIPAAVAAGAAVAQLSCAMATQSATSIRRHLPVSVGAVLLVALVGWRVWALAAAFAANEAGTWQSIASALVLIVVLVGLWRVVALVRPQPSRPSAAALEGEFSSVAQPIAAVLTIGVVPATFCYIAAGIAYSLTFTDGPTQALTRIGDLFSAAVVVSLTRLAIGLALIVIGLWQARRARHVLPELFVSIGLVIVSRSVFALVGAQDWLWTGQAITVVVTATAVGMLAWLLIRRRLTPGRAAPLGVALLLAALFDQRSFVEDPLRAVFGFTGAAFILFGFVWSMLTGGGTANGTSARYPRSVRVLFYLANALFGITVLAFTALARDPGATIQLDAVAGLGSGTLGNGLLAAALLASLSGALRAGSSASEATPAPASEAASPPASRPASPPTENPGQVPSMPG